MKAIDTRIRRLQQQLIPDKGQEQGIWLTVRYGQKFALARDRCIEILRECGLLPTTRWLVLTFWDIPDGLNAQELEQYLRTNGAEICGTSRDEEARVTGAVSRLNYANDNAQLSSGVLR